MNETSTWVALALVGVAIAIAVYWSFGRTPQEELPDDVDEDAPLLVVDPGLLVVDPGGPALAPMSGGT